MKDNPNAGREMGGRTEVLDEDDMKQVQAAASMLDPNIKGHWSSIGLPSLHWMRVHTGIPTLTREEVNEATKGFLRFDHPDYQPDPDEELDDEELGDQEEAEDDPVAAAMELAKVLGVSEDLINSPEKIAALKEQMETLNGKPANDTAPSEGPPKQEAEEELPLSEKPSGTEKPSGKPSEAKSQAPANKPAKAKA